MALQPCRTALLRGARQAARSSSLRACYATDIKSNDQEIAKIHEELAASPPERPPRWSQTPPGMAAPIQMDTAKNPQNKIWTVNNDPAVLDDMYERFLGHGGSKMLPEELKWLAITHKSFDQGRRGFNDRLALMGRMTLRMEATKAITSLPPMEQAQKHDQYSHLREPFNDPRLASVDNLHVIEGKNVTGTEKLYALAQDVGLKNVVRWKPRQPHNLRLSGVDTVLGSAVMAIIGAVTLQHGMAVGAKVARERVISRVHNGIIP